MTENLLQKLEEKIMVLLTEIEDLRTKVQHLDQENSSLKSEKEMSSKKLSDLLSLLDTINTVDNVMTPVTAVVKPALVQG